MTGTPSPSGDSDAWNQPRSGGAIQPAGRRGWTATWYACPKCDYRERAMSDGLLEHDYCPRHGEPLRRVAPGSAGQDGAGSGQAG